MTQIRFTPASAITREEYFRLRADPAPMPTRGATEAVGPTWSELVADLRRQREWRQRAACAGMDVTVFVPRTDRGRTDEARAVCAGCPVTVECADEAERTEALGVWGGGDERERRAARRRSA